MAVIKLLYLISHTKLF